MRPCFLDIYHPSFESLKCFLCKRPVWWNYWKQAFPKWYYSMSCIILSRTSYFRLKWEIALDIILSPLSLTYIKDRTLHAQYHHHLHGTMSSFHEFFFSCTKIQIIFFCRNEKTACVCLFFQCPFKTQRAYLQTHNEHTLKEKAPGRRCSAGTGQHGRFTIDSLFWTESDWEIIVFFCRR